MKKIGLILTSFVCFALWGSCNSIQASRNYVSRTVEAPGLIDAVTLEGSMDVEYRQGENVNIEIYAPDNVIDQVEVLFDGKEVTVRYRKGTVIRGDNDTEVRITSPEFRAASVSGSGDIDILGSVLTSAAEFTVRGSGDIECKSISCENLSAKIEGSGSIDIEGIMATNIRATVSGSGDIELKGSPEVIAATFTISGSGDIEAEEIPVHDVSFVVRGSGEIKTRAINSLTGEVKGSGRVWFLGNPKVNVTGRANAVKPLR